MKALRIRTVIGYLLVVSAGFWLVFAAKTQLVPAIDYVVTAVSAALD